MQKRTISLFLGFILFVSCSGILSPAHAAETIQKPESKKEKTEQVLEEAAEIPEENLEENSSEALEMIALRMKSLSSSLNEMPNIPQLNQTIQLPLENSEENQPDARKEDPETSQNKN